MQTWQTWSPKRPWGSCSRVQRNHFEFLKICPQDADLANLVTKAALRVMLEGAKKSLWIPQNMPAGCRPGKPGHRSGLEGHVRGCKEITLNSSKYARRMQTWQTWSPKRPWGSCSRVQRNHFEFLKICPQDADLANLVNEAALLAGRANKSEVCVCPCLYSCFTSYDMLLTLSLLLCEKQEMCVKREMWKGRYVWKGNCGRKAGVERKLCGKVWEKGGVLWSTISFYVGNTSVCMILVSTNQCLRVFNKHKPVSGCF